MMLYFLAQLDIIRKYFFKLKGVFAWLSQKEKQVKQSNVNVARILKQLSPQLLVVRIVVRTFSPILFVVIVVFTKVLK